MRPDFFWNSWQAPYKLIYKILLAVFVASVAVFTLTYIAGNSFVIDWVIVNTINPVTTLYDSFQLGLYRFPLLVENYVIQQSFVASGLQIHEWPAYVLLLWLGIFITVMLSLISDLSRFWFLVCAVLFTLLLLGLKLDYLVLFNQYNKMGLVIAFVLYYPALYIFHFVKKDIAFSIRLMVYGLATALFYFIIYKFSNVPVPFLHLANYGIYVPLILTIIFTFMVGHEIISGLLRIISSGTLTGEKNGLFHFLIISVIFLLNVALLLLKNTRMYDSGIYLMGAFLILTVASIVGIWGYRSRELTYNTMFAFFPQGAFLFILLAINSHITLAYFFINGNDFLVEVIEDAIVFSQLAYGLMFLVYFLANFFDMFRQNADVSKILYKPLRMPYFTSRLAGLIAILALFLKFNMTPYNQALAGFYSGIGDLYLYSEQYLAAQEYYNMSSSFSGTSHRANFAMATMENRTGNTSEEIEYLKQAIEKNPTAFAYANLAARLRDNKRYFEALFALEDGLSEFPNSGQLMLNLGLIYQDLNNVDSAFLLFNEAQQFKSSKSEAAANIYGLLRIKDLSIKPDTLNDLLKTAKAVAAINNLVVLSNELNKPASDLAEVNFEDPEKAQIDQVVYNYNKLLNQPQLLDSQLLEKIRVFYDSSNTSWFQDNMNMATALSLWKMHHTAGAFERLNQLALLNPEDEYNSILGLMSLGINAYGLAINYFKNSFQEGYRDIAPELAFAYMEHDELGKASFIWQQILQAGDTSDREIARKMLLVSEVKNIDDILYANIETKYAFIRYRSRDFDLEKLQALILSIENEDVQALSLVRLMDRYIELQQKDKALEMLEKMGNLNISMTYVLEEIDLAQCRFAYFFHEMELMTRLTENLLSEDVILGSYIKLFRTMQLQDSAEAKSSYMHLAGGNPFFEPGVMEAVNFLNSSNEGTDEAYGLLLKAVSLNPFSIELNKAYALQSIRVGLRSYAMETREELRQMMSSVAFEQFDLEFERSIKLYETNTSVW